MHKTYRFIIDDDLKSLDFPMIHYEIYFLLNDPNGWRKYGYTFKPVYHNEDILIRLSTPKTIQKECGDGNLSCAELGGRNVHLNVYRWLYGSPASKLPLNLYRQYMVSHEIGHILGYEHIPIPHSGPAPIMIQQTLGIGNCIPNTKVFL